MKAVVAAFNQEKALVGAFSVITNLRMEHFEALQLTLHCAPLPGADHAYQGPGAALPGVPRYQGAAAVSLHSKHHVSHVPLCATCLPTHLTRVPAPVHVSCAELRVPQYGGEVAALEARKSEVNYGGG